MATIPMEKLGLVYTNTQQIMDLPPTLMETAPSMPGTVRDTEVPHYFRGQFISTGYRPLYQEWRYYFLSLFQRHNETVNVWTHLLPSVVFLFKLCQFNQSVDFVGDPHSWPLLVLLLSSVIYTGCSVVAHLLGGKSELCHYAFYFLDYVGIAQYHIGCAMVHFYYAIEEDWHQRMNGIFMPVASFLACLSLFACCYGKYCDHHQPTLTRMVCQMIPLLVVFFWTSSPVINRILSCTTDCNDPAIPYYHGQVVSSLSAGFFFAVPLLERCFPGQCDFMGQGHQLFHILTSFFTLSQIHTAHLNFENRRELYTRLHHSGDAAFFVKLYMLSFLICLLFVAFLWRKIKNMLPTKNKSE
ncbi:membrane progestin receptor alpha-B-like [Nelusetta ayraudi]|uniref:membrane progestin receptor alpha-B-like n=1 Tax=Nelusetta ayraudi TaxID=303726 RepID=UPI003F71C276